MTPSTSARSAVATTGDGAHIRYAIWGEARPERRVALAHALAMKAEFWGPVAEALGPDWQVLAVDCRGHGASSKTDGPYTVDGFASDLDAVLDDAGWDRAVIGGASMGGCVAQAFAAARPERTTGLALIDTTAWYGEDGPKAWEGRARKAAEQGLAALLDFQKERWFGDAFRSENPERVALAVEIFLANNVAAYGEACRMLGRCDLRAALPTITCPAQVVVGEEDYATPVAMAEALASGIRGAALTVLPAARHFTPLERPEAIAGAIRGLAA